jgi:excisionase family DNA binding protein
VGLKKISLNVPGKQPMRDLLTPKQVARALDVSESSIKRWCDKGGIPTQYTAGGHRRISMPALIQFLREGKYELVHPEALGLPPTSGQSVRVVDRARKQMADALVAGDEMRCRQIAIDLYLAEHSISAICDEVFAAAFRDIGQQWEHGDAEIYQERRGCEIALRVLHELRMFLQVPQPDAPLAIGGAASGDPYILGTTMVELVLRDASWNAVSLGANLPFPTIEAAIRTHRPRLFWLSCSHIADETSFLTGYGQLHEECGSDVAFVVGGHALDEGLRQKMKYAAHCDSMQHLEGFVQTLSRRDKK